VPLFVKGQKKHPLSGRITEQRDELAPLHH
jgi:hypothetical protein